MECFKNIIGITRTPCECLKDCLPEGYTKSISGLFIDELPEAPVSLQAVGRSADCNDELGIILTKARENSIKEFKRELYKHLQSRLRSTALPFSGKLGSMSNTRTMQVSDNYAGIKISGKKAGAEMTVRKIITFFDTTKAFDILLYRRNELIKTIPVQSLAGRYKENDIEDIKLDLSDENGYTDYHLIYQTDGLQPKDNAVDCGCGSEKTISQYISLSGVSGNSISGINEFNSSRNVNGIVLDVDINCSIDTLICNAYKNEFIKVAIEWSVLRKSVEILITGILNSGVINRDNMANREQMYYNSKSLLKKFNNDVQWIAENMDIADSDCFVCNAKNDLYYMGGIRS